MKIQGRIVNVKRHTIGFKVGGKNRTRKETVRLAKQGKIDGVTVRAGGNDGSFITSATQDVNLYDLPVRVSETGKV
jgi:hypothetical protein